MAVLLLILIFVSFPSEVICWKCTQNERYPARILSCFVFVLRTAQSEKNWVVWDTNNCTDETLNYVLKVMLKGINVSHEIPNLSQIMEDND